MMTEPMVRVLSASCIKCGLTWEPTHNDNVALGPPEMSATDVREMAEKAHHGPPKFMGVVWDYRPGDCGGQLTYATEPV